MANAKRERLIRSLQDSQAHIHQLLESVAGIQDWQPEPAEWSFRLIAAHLASIERNWHQMRIQRIAAGEQPHFTAYLNTEPTLGQSDLRESLQQWSETRQTLLDFVAMLNEEKLFYTGTHDVLGTLTVLDTLEEILAYDNSQARHIQQLIHDYNEEMMPTTKGTICLN